MDAEQFLQSAMDPQLWLRKSVALRLSGDRLLDALVDATARWAVALKANEEEKSESAEMEAEAYLMAAKVMHGLALETASKSYLLRTNPAGVEFKMSADGQGALRDVEVRQFGVSMGAGHDLLRLGEKAGLFTTGGRQFSTRGRITRQ